MDVVVEINCDTLFPYIETMYYLCTSNSFVLFVTLNIIMTNEIKFTPIFLKEATEFLRHLSADVRQKILKNIEKAQIVNDVKLFKKLKGNIWEFRTSYQGIEYRLLAFWDKRDNKKTLVVATHGFTKKTNKIPEKEIEKAERIRNQYFKD